MSTPYLVFTLAAPIASFGTVAVGERRPTWDRPSKSQIIGLVAGCLGIERIEEERQRELAVSLGFAVRIDDPGHLATDYHTTQAAKDASIRKRIKAGFTVNTRAEELACDDLKTILSRREFRVGSHYTVAIWKTRVLAPALDEIATALRAPVFVPFAGRKANALSLPMAPRLVDAADVGEAFTVFDASEPPGQAIFKAGLRFRLRAICDRPVYADAADVPRQLVSRLEQRRDVPESRAKWWFGLRTEALLKPARGEH